MRSGTHSKIPVAKRIVIRKLYMAGLSNERIARGLGLKTSAVTSYLKFHAPDSVKQHTFGYYHSGKRLDIPFEKLTPRAKMLVIRFGGKKFKL